MHAGGRIQVIWYGAVHEFLSYFSYHLPKVVQAGAGPENMHQCSLVCPAAPAQIRRRREEIVEHCWGSVPSQQEFVISLLGFGTNRGFVCKPDDSLSFGCGEVAI